MRLTAALMALLFAAPVGADVTRICPDPMFTVTAETDALVDQTCQSAVRAVDSLRSCQIELPEPVEIHVVDAINGTMGPCLGMYHCGEQQIEVLSPEALLTARDPDGAFAGISNPALWDSILVHELTHAAYEPVTCPFTSCIATSEYASYVMQVRSMPPEEQAKFGEQIVLKSKTSAMSVSAMIYYMAPDVFAKRAWQHFNARPEPCEYLSLIMDGKIFFDMEAP